MGNTEGQRPNTMVHPISLSSSDPAYIERKDDKRVHVGTAAKWTEAVQSWRAEGKKKLAHLYERQDQGSESDKFKVASGKTKKLNAQE